jgi:hypothetical protein
MLPVTVYPYEPLRLCVDQICACDEGAATQARAEMESRENNFMQVIAATFSLVDGGGSRRTWAD